MPPERIDFAEVSPMTQRIASSRLDLPQPLGPTTPVRPGSIRSSAGSTKLLKPASLSLRISIAWAGSGASLPRPGPLQRRLHRGPVGLVHAVAIEEEGRRARDLVLLVLRQQPAGERLHRGRIRQARTGLVRSEEHTSE